MNRQIRNVTIALVLITLILGLCFYASTVIYILLVWGPDRLHFHAIQPNFKRFPYSLYPTIFQYLEHWWKNPDYYDFALRTKLLGATFSPLLLISIVVWTTKERLAEWRPLKAKESVHGDAKWAGEKEIRKAGLRSKKGMILGRDKKGMLIADGYQHALLFAPTGSGKGVGFAIPNLLFWNDSCFVHDIKLENFDLTSGWRKRQGQKVYLWNPADPTGVTHCYNPLDWLSDKPGQVVDDVQKIASLLMPEQDFWVNEARSLFVGVVLYLHAVPEKITSFGEVVRTMRSDDVTYNLAVVLDTIGKKLHPVAYMNIAAFLQKAEKERSGVISTMNSSLELWANPLIDTATASSDFDIQQFKKEKSTVYVGITPDNLTRLRPLMQVFYQQATEFLCRSIPSKEEPYGVLFLMDEFPTLGEMEQFKTGIAYFRGYNVRLFLIIQDTEQLKGIYEDAGMNSFLSNSTYRITFAANNIETANLISQLVGNKTVEQESLNKPKFLDFNPASRSLHVSETQRALLLPQEVIMLDRNKQILLIESTAPIKSDKIRYYEDAMFKRRLLKSCFVPTQEPFDPNAQNAQQGDVATTQQEPPPLEGLPPAEENIQNTKPNESDEYLDQEEFQDDVIDEFQDDSIDELQDDSIDELQDDSIDELQDK